MASTDAATDLEGQLLAATGGGGDIADTYPWALARGADHDAVVGAVKSLVADYYVVAAPTTVEFWVLTEEAEGYVERGSPEAQVFRAVPGGAEGCDEAALAALVGEALVKVGLGKCLKNKWVARDKASGRYSKLVRCARRRRTLVCRGCAQPRFLSATLFSPFLPAHFFFSPLFFRSLAGRRDWHRRAC